MLAALQQSQQALGDSVESQRRLVADASHELRTPVASIRTDIETLLGHPDLPPGERAEILAAADERIEELSESIGDIIELARGDTDDTAAADDVRLDHVVEEAITRLGRHSPGRPVDADLAPAVVRARPDRLFRAVNNLLDNADKYSPEGEPIEVRVAEGVVSVSDHGPGIPEADRPHLFDRFWRGVDLAAPGRLRPRARDRASGRDRERGRGAGREPRPRRRPLHARAAAGRLAGFRR